MVLARALPYLPRAVHLAVVDPGVGSARRPIAVLCRSGSVLVGPDNGLLVPAADILGGAELSRVVSNRQLMLGEISATFHGRDLFAPVVAHLAAGVAFAHVGPECPVQEMVRLPAPQMRIHEDHLHTHVVHADHFGNLQLGAPAAELVRLVDEGALVKVSIGGTTLAVPYRITFSDVPAGEFVLTEDSAGCLSLSMNLASAALALPQALPGTPVVLGRPGFECA